MKLLVIGSGGREHALVWKLRQSAMVRSCFIAPGNPGIAQEPGVQCISIAANEYEKIIVFCKEEKIDFVVIGPDQALADGLVDRLAEAGIAAFGPSAAAAQLESSKAFAKEVMREAGIPTAAFAVFENLVPAKKFIETTNWQHGYVIKADGLALGKGVIVTSSRAEALDAVQEFQKKIGKAAKKIIIEEKLVGQETSAFVLCDGKDFVFLGCACDYKQLLVGGMGPNTGGMGAYTPADWLPADAQKKMEEKIAHHGEEGYSL